MTRLACLPLVLAMACGDNTVDDPCEGVATACIGLTAGASFDEVQTALIEVPTGGAVLFGAGRFEFEADLSLDVDGVTIRGAGRDRTVLSFANQTTGPQGLLVTADDFLIEDIAFEDAPGDALKLLGSVGVTIRDVRVEWTAGPQTSNGAYGLYPVQCKDVLIEDSFVSGASDAGIYVGQSERIIVRNNRVELNVAGIEIENSFDADVHDNIATTNTGGVLVFNLPDLAVENGARTRVFNNQIFENNTVNFAPPNNIVASVPTGTGMVLLAAHDVEVFDNVIRDHKSINIGIISYIPTGIPVTDESYDQFPTRLHIHDNALSGTSDQATGDLGAALIIAVGELLPNGPFVIPDIGWDGVLDPDRDPNNPADKICIHDNGDADFINLGWPLVTGALPSFDATPHACTHPALPAVLLQ